MGFNELEMNFPNPGNTSPLNIEDRWGAKSQITQSKSIEAFIMFKLKSTFEKDRII